MLNPRAFDYTLFPNRNSPLGRIAGAVTCAAGSSAGSMKLHVKVEITNFLTTILRFLRRTVSAIQKFSSRCELKLAIVRLPHQANQSANCLRTVLLGERSNLRSGLIRCPLWGAVTPGPLAPARELLGEMLLEMKKPAQALEQFEATLTKEPGRLRALYGAGRAAQLSGRREASQKYFGELLKVCGRADKPGRAEILEAQRAISQK